MGHDRIRRKNVFCVHEDMYEAESGASIHRWSGIPRLNLENSWYANNPQCYGGYAPYGCSKSIGQAMLKINAEEMAEIIRKVKADDDLVNIANLIPASK